MIFKPTRFAESEFYSTFDISFFIKTRTFNYITI